jgi:RNA polymerase sigma factor (sigma-70 family)
MAKTKAPLRSQEERDRLITENIRLAYDMANRMCKARASVRRLGYDDAVGVALLTLTRAAEGYRPELGWKFSTYAGASMAREIVRAAISQSVVAVPDNVFGPAYARTCRDIRAVRRAADRARRVLFFGSGTLAHFGDEGNFEDKCLQDPRRDGLADREDQLDVQALLRKSGVDAGDRRALQLYFWDGLTLAECAAAMGGITRERVRQRISRAVHRLRRLLGLAEGRLPKGAYVKITPEPTCPRSPKKRKGKCPGGK